MIIELHLLQSFPVSNLNRDDLGQPKTATFGGHLRARISSQSLKRAARLLFKDYGLDQSDIGIRTRLIVDSTTAQLVEAGRDADEARRVVVAGLWKLGFGYDEAKKSTQYLLYVGRHAPEVLAGYCNTDWDKLKTEADAAAAAAAKKKAAKKEPGERDSKPRPSRNC